MNKKKIQQMIEAHRAWLQDETQGCRADFSRANLMGANLHKVDLRKAVFTGANLTGATLDEALLDGAFMAYVNLTGASLCEAQLEDAELVGAIGADAKFAHAHLNTAKFDSARLSAAVLRAVTAVGASFRGTHLLGAEAVAGNFQEANFTTASLQGSDFRRSSFYGASFTRARLDGVNLSMAGLPEIEGCPRKGEFRAYKKVCGGYILELLIPEDAKRTGSLIGKKCRASKAKVVGVARAFSGVDVPPMFRSLHDAEFFYRVGETVSVDDFDPDIRVECTRGIHFFMTRIEAENY